VKSSDPKSNAIERAIWTTTRLRRSVTDSLPADAPRVVTRSTLDADIDLLAPVHRAVRELAADPRVATELRAVDVLDGELLLVGQFEEAA